MKKISPFLLQSMRTDRLAFSNTENKTSPCKLFKNSHDQDQDGDDNINSPSIISRKSTSDSEEMRSEKENSELIKLLLTKSTLFSIKVLTFDCVSNKEEVMTTFKCSYSENNLSSSFTFYIDDTILYRNLTREVTVQLLEYADKLLVSEINMFVSRKHKEYSILFYILLVLVKIIQSFMTIGFKSMNITLVGDIEYRVLKLELNCNKYSEFIL
jgi:hypothetical protein